MPFETVIVLGGVFAVFMGFAALLVVGDLTWQRGSRGPS